MAFWSKEKNRPEINWKVTKTAEVESEVVLDREELFDNAVKQVVEEKVYKVVLDDLRKQASSSEEVNLNEKLEEAKDFAALLASNPKYSNESIQSLADAVQHRYPMFRVRLILDTIEITMPDPTLEMLALSITKRYMEKEI